MTINATLTRLQQLLPQLFQPIQVTGDPYLRFQLTAELPTLISMELVQEAVVVPAQSISPLPNLPDFSIGLMNARDRVFLVVDLGQLLGLPPLPINLRDYQVVVIRLPGQVTNGNESGKFLGLAVHRVRGVARFETAQLQPPVGKFPASLQPYLLGSFGENNERVLVLDTGSIVNTPSLLKNPLIST